MTFYLILAQEPLVDQGRLIVEVSRTYSDTPHSVGLLWTRDRPTAKELSLHNTGHSQETDIHASGGIRTRNPSKQAAADPRLRLRGHWVWQILYIGSLCYLATLICHFPAGSFAALTQPTRSTAYRRSRGAARSDKEYLSDKIMSRLFGV